MGYSRDSFYRFKQLYSHKLQSGSDFGKETARVYSFCVHKNHIVPQIRALPKETSFYVDDKSNEKTAIPDLLNSLDLTGTLVSIDAIACEQKNADLIIEKKGNYIFALKNNHKHLYEQVHERMQ